MNCPTWFAYDGSGTFLPSSDPPQVLRTVTGRFTKSKLNKYNWTKQLNKMSVEQKSIEQKVSWTKINWTKSQLSKWISEQIFDWSNTHWTNASEQNYWNNWTNVELNKLSQQGYPEAPPGGMRSGAQRHEARGVWGACPPFYMK